MELEIWGGEFGLPSIDVQCLQMMTLSKFFNLNVTYIEKNINPLIGSKLPKFKDEFCSITDYENFANYIINKNAKDNKNNLNNLKAYKKLFEETLEPAIKYIFWIQKANYAQVTKKTFAKLCKFPFNFFVPSYIQNETKNYFKILYSDSSDCLFENEIMKKAQKCIRLIADKLKNNKYFDDTPGELDALVFGYLAVILNVKFPYCNDLRLFTMEHCNLIYFTNNILQEYFEIKEQIKFTKTSIENLEVASWRDIIFTGIFSSSLIILFSIYSGLLEINFSDNKFDKEEVEENNLKKYEIPIPNLEIPSEVFPNLNKNSSNKRNKTQTNNKSD